MYNNQHDSEECTPVGADLNHSDHGYGIQDRNYSMYVTNTEDADDDYYEYIEWILYARITVAIAVFGILGNILNLIILTQRKIKSSMDRMER